MAACTSPPSWASPGSTVGRRAAVLHALVQHELVLGAFGLRELVQHASILHELVQDIHTHHEPLAVERKFQACKLALEELALVSSIFASVLQEHMVECCYSF